MKSRYIIIAIIVFFMVLLIIYPDKYVISVYNGLNLYALCVLPALLPFIFFTKILSELNFGYDLGNLLNRPLKKLYNSPGVSGYVLIMSMLSGYPVGAKILADMYEKNLINDIQAKSVSSFTSTSGPLFVVGTVGVSMLSDKTAGFIILISHYLSALLNGFFYRIKKTCENKLILPPLIDTNNILGESILGSITSVAVVGGYIAIFNMALDVLTNIGAIALFAKILSLTKLDYNLSLGFVSAFIEITKGCLIMGKAGFPLKNVVPLCAFVISFGGLSVTLQSMTFLSKCKIKPAFYFLSKFTQAILAFIISYPLCLLFL